jgi:flagellar hook-associated protein 1 FlgK
MIGLSVGLQIARKALSAYQLAITVHGNNIANVNTEGYSRRRTEIREATSTALTFGHVGLGVDVETIARMRNRFLDASYRNENAQLGKFETMGQTLSEVEMILNEPSETGLGTILGDFWNSWQDLANNPESQTTRGLVVQKAAALCTTLKNLDDQLTVMRKSLAEEIKSEIDLLNSIASNVAELNGRIVTSEVSGHEASTLRDERDRLLDQLSDIVDIQVFERSDGSAAVMIGTEALVDRTETVPITIESRYVEGLVITDVNLGEGGRSIQPPGGKLAGLLEARDRIIPNYLSKLDTLAASLVDNVNRLHRLGYDLHGSPGVDFFDPAGTTAATIGVSEAVLADASLIAASTDGSPGNADNALAIAALRFEGVIAEDGSSIDEYYSSLIGSLGLEALRVENERQNQEALLTEIDNRRESVKGVSIDEETTDLLSAQHAYEAAARLVIVIDEMMVSLMSMVGR